MKRKIKVKLCGHDEKKEYSYGHFIVNILNKYYELEFSEKPDYIFFNEADHEHTKYAGIKIFFTGENISPNFNSCDYAISFDYIDFEDRHYRLPLYLLTVFYNPDELLIAGKEYLKNKQNFTKEDLKNKTDFCSFVYSNYRAEEQRKLMFDILSGYKKVNAGGSYLNNIGGKKIKNKLEFELKHKFSIAFENSSRSGYTTEKIVSSLVAKTIPIYWGNPNISREFNTKRFINCHDYSSFNDVLKRVIELDTNDELYVQTINEPICAQNYNFEGVKDGLDIFLRNIIDQPLELAKRRTINPVKAIEINRQQSLIAKNVARRSFILKIMTAIYQPFKPFEFFENLKYKYFRKNK
ncbi:alpha-1,3-fucosyl transferase [Candidatus Gracilibacteria bacterium]|nr:alpha-1,3-fucosyl transferase [Candidatus Gracilibacteria bacterium]MCF7898674.1 alpha-1,3-fucosyl transferase [Candidatus Paceibacterota bacterium]